MITYLIKTLKIYNTQKYKKIAAKHLFEVGKLFLLARFLFLLPKFFFKKVYFFVSKFWYIKKLLHLCNTIKHRIINL